MLEARDRIGGRIWTSGGFLGGVVDLGASWIHGHTANPVYKLATELGIETLVTDDVMRPLTFASSGARLTDARRDRLDALFTRLVKDKAYLRQSQLQDEGPDQSLGRALDSILAELLADKSIDATDVLGIRHMIATEIEGAYATDVGKLSLRHWDQGHWFEGDDLLIPGGYKQVVDRLASGIDVRLASPVRSVRRESRGVKLTTTLGREFFASKVVVTLPLGVLQRGDVEFVPALPAAKLAAVQRLGVGTMNKVYLGFDTAFWPEDVTWLEYLGEVPNAWPFFFNAQRYFGKPALVAFNVGSFAEALEAQSDAATIAGVVAVLSKIGRQNGWAVGAPKEVRLTRWRSDPFSRGSYSYVPVGASLSDYDRVGASVEGSLYFAGEATSSADFMTVHAAYLSGIRAADEVISAA